MTEIWKAIQGYEGLYEVSNLGNVRSLDKTFKNKQGLATRKGRVLIPFYEEKKGYYQVRLSKNGKNKTFRIHRLVALAFLENPFNYTDVNHKDEIKTNNNVSNLEWCTRKYNNNYGTKPERTRKAMIGNTNGRKAWFAKGKRGHMIIFNDPSKFGRIPDPPEPPSDEWFEEHCPRCKYNHEYEKNGKRLVECLQGGCTGFVERE